METLGQKVESLIGVTLHGYTCQILNGIKSECMEIVETSEDEMINLMDINQTECVVASTGPEVCYSNFGLLRINWQLGYENGVVKVIFCTSVKNVGEWEVTSTCVREIMEESDLVEEFKRLYSDFLLEIFTL